jgi:hypothetical protein
MPNALNFKMRPQDDLSVRTDFTFDLMDETKRQIQTIVEEVPAVKELQNRATVNIRLRGSLSSVEIDLDVIPSMGTEMDDAELKKTRSQIFKEMNENFSPEIGGVLQRAITRARARM